MGIEFTWNDISIDNEYLEHFREVLDINKINEDGLNLDYLQSWLDYMFPFGNPSISKSNDWTLDVNFSFKDFEPYEWDGEVWYVCLDDGVDLMYMIDDNGDYHFRTNDDRIRILLECLKEDELNEFE